MHINPAQRLVTDTIAKLDELRADLRTEAVDAHEYGHHMDALQCEEMADRLAIFLSSWYACQDDS